MGGLTITSSFLCLVVVLHYAAAQWPTWVLAKGKTCEDRCKTKLKMCNPVEEFMDCKCFPRRLVQHYLKYATLPIEPSVMCLMSSPKAPKCCAIYNGQKDAFKSGEDVAELKKNLGSKEHDIETLKAKLGAGEEENKQCISYLEMFNTLNEQTRNQKLETDKLKESLSKELGALEERLESEKVQTSKALETVERRLQSGEEEGGHLANLTARMSSMLDEQNEELENMTKACSTAPWKKSAGRCPSGWSWFDGSCFLISEEEETFSSAEQSCEMEGGQLATVDSAERQTYIAELVKITNTRQFVQLHTNDTLPYNTDVQYVQDLGIDITNHTSVLFRIKSCAGGHILLSKVKGDILHETYHVIVGSHVNTLSFIIEDFVGQNRFVFKHPDKSYPLKCNFYQTFWMSWGVGVIRVGYGESVGKNEFMSWVDPTPHDVNFIGIGTGWGNTADWVFTTETFVPGKFWIGADVAGYTNWGVDEPSTTGKSTSSGGPCISMDMHEDMTWDEDDCEQLRNYVCQRNDEF